MNNRVNKYSTLVILIIFLAITPAVAADYYRSYTDRASSDNGTFIIKSTENSTIYLFENGNNGPTWSYNIHGNIWSVAISADEKYIAIGSDGGWIWLFDQKGTVVWNKTFGNAGIKSIEFSKDSQYLDASNFINQAFYIDLDGNSAIRPATHTTSEIPSFMPVVTQTQIPEILGISGIYSVLQDNLNLLIWIIFGFCLACIVWYTKSRWGHRQKEMFSSAVDIVTLRNFTIFSIVLIVIGFLPDYYSLDGYIGYFQISFKIGVFCILIAYFLYAVKCWEVSSQICAILMVTIPMFVYYIATSKIPNTTTNVLIYLGILFCVNVVISAVLLFVSDKVKKGFDGTFKGYRYSRYFEPKMTYALFGLLIVSIIAVNSGSTLIFTDNLNFMTKTIQKTSSQIFTDSNTHKLSPTTTYQNSQGLPTKEPNLLDIIESAVSNPEPVIDIPSLERRIHELINQQRTSHGLSALRFDSSLITIARKHSEDMAKNNYFAHTNLQGLDPSDRGTQAGYSCYKNYGSYYTTGIAENIFQTSHSTTYNGIKVNDMESSETIAQSTVNSWMNSPGHRQNILTSTYDREGIGVGISSDKTVYVTEDFC